MDRKKNCTSDCSTEQGEFSPIASKASTRCYGMPKLTAKILATKVETEVAAFGVVSFRMPAEYFVERLRGIEGFMRSRRIWISLLLCCAQHSVFFAFRLLNRTYCPVDT